VHGTCREQFVALYESGEAIYKGTLADGHMAELVEKILASPRVSRRFKRILTGE